MGLTLTFGHTSVISCVVMSLTELCWMEGIAPFGQMDAWRTLKLMFDHAHG